MMIEERKLGAGESEDDRIEFEENVSILPVSSEKYEN